MKKYFYLAVFAIGLGMTSCSSNCCTLLTAKICEEDLPATFTSWDDYKASLTAAGYNCD